MQSRKNATAPCRGKRVGRSSDAKSQVLSLMTAFLPRGILFSNGPIWSLARTLLWHTWQSASLPRLTKILMNLTATKDKQKTSAVFSPVRRTSPPPHPRTTHERTNAGKGCGRQDNGGTHERSDWPTAVASWRTMLRRRCVAKGLTVKRHATCDEFFGGGGKTDENKINKDPEEPPCWPQLWNQPHEEILTWVGEAKRALSIPTSDSSCTYRPSRGTHATSTTIGWRHGCQSRRVP